MDVTRTADANSDRVAHMPPTVPTKGVTRFNNLPAKFAELARERTMYTKTVKFKDES